MKPTAGGLFWTALIVVGGIALYHKDMIPGLKGQKAGA